MGHAGAIVSGNRETAASKEASFREAGVDVAETTDEIVEPLEATVAAWAVPRLQGLAAPLAVR